MDTFFRRAVAALPGLLLLRAPPRGRSGEGAGRPVTAVGESAAEGAEKAGDVAADTASDGPATDWASESGGTGASPATCCPDVIIQ
jgi:hypothetical protein